MLGIAACTQHIAWLAFLGGSQRLGQISQSCSVKQSPSQQVQRARFYLHLVMTISWSLAPWGAAVAPLLVPLLPLLHAPLL